jgi:gamma-polyglutamate biosynthesis protein CapA
MRQAPPWKLRRLVRLLSILLLFGAWKARGAPAGGPGPVQVRDFHAALPPDPGHVRLAFMGDINLGRKVGMWLGEKGDAWAFAACKPILDGVDLAVANLESPVGSGKEPYTEKSVYLEGRTKDLDALAEGGIGLVTLSNNHILDYGPGPARQTVQGLEARGIRPVGFLEADSAQKPVYVRLQGMTLAFLAYCSVCPGKFGVERERPGVEPALPSIMVPEVRRAKARADEVIVLIHWGREYYGANALQRKLAQDLREAGADLVIGSHPHVLQQVEMRQGSLVAYSLGNFLFDMTHASCREGCILLVDLRKGLEPRWKAVPLDLTGGRPVPLPPADPRALTVQRILSRGYEYGGRKNEPVRF